MVGCAVGRVGKSPRLGPFPTLCIRPPALVNATTYWDWEAACNAVLLKCSDEASICMIFMGGDDLFGRKISGTDTVNCPFLYTFGWIQATPRQPQ